MSETPEQFMLRFAATLRQTAAQAATVSTANVSASYREGFEDGMRIAADTLEAVAVDRLQRAGL